MVQMPVQSLVNQSLANESLSDSQAHWIEDRVVDPGGPDWDILGEEWESDEPELETDFHRDQIDLLLRLMKWTWRDRNDIYCSGNTTVYYDQAQRTTRNFRGPDIYVVLDADPRQRRSWMIWKEGGRYPNLVIELLSPATARVDRTTKKELYQNVWRLPNYIWFHPETMEFKGFRLVNDLYEEIQPTNAGWLWLDQLELFLGIHERTLRLFTATGEMLLFEEEAAQLEIEAAQLEVEAAQLEVEAAQLKVEAAQLEVAQERSARESAQEQANQERSARELAEERAERLAAKLRELGIEE
jgi:Uma2 family endonuclease